jgi:hypothetical protein
MQDHNLQLRNRGHERNRLVVEACYSSSLKTERKPTVTRQYVM